MNPTPPAAEPLGIIAGAGRFPFMVADAARRDRRHVVVVALRGLADPALADHADAFHWSGLARLGAWVRLLRRHGVRHAILAGAVRKDVMYGRFRLLRLLPDWTSLRLWFFQLSDKRNDSVLSAVADVLQARGIHLDDAVRYSAEDMATVGTLTPRVPTDDQTGDIEFGWPIAREIARLDIGQSIAVKEREVIAVEAIEGTDRMIRRAGELCPVGGWTLIKVAKPSQDMRFDVPTIGPDTIENLARCKAACLVVQAGKTLIIDRLATLDAARRRGIAVLARNA